jgi:hypothetical protein
MIITSFRVTLISVAFIGQDMTSVALAEIGTTGETPLSPQPDPSQRLSDSITPLTTTVLLDRSLWGLYSSSG